MPELAHIFRWDLDKTYLQTDFETLRGLVRSAFERAEQKRAVPGAAVLLRELAAARGRRICFISGSPRQMRRVLEHKLQLDGVQFDEFILKPNMSNLLRGRFRALRDQVGYKLPALLAGRLEVAGPVPETLFGDDAEGDAFIYSLYADILRGTAGREVVLEILERLGVYKDVLARTMSLMARIEVADSVRRIFIRLDKRSPLARFDRYGPRVVPVANYLQAAAVLFEDGLLGAQAWGRVAADLLAVRTFPMEGLIRSLAQLVERGQLGPQVLAHLARQLPRALAAAAGGGGDGGRPDAIGALALRLDVLAQAPAGPGRQPLDIDYLAALAEDPPVRASRRRKTARARPSRKK